MERSIEDPAAARRLADPQALRTPVAGDDGQRDRDLGSQPPVERRVGGREVEVQRLAVVLDQAGHRTGVGDELVDRGHDRVGVTVVDQVEDPAQPRPQAADGPQLGLVAGHRAGDAALVHVLDERAGLGQLVDPGAVVVGVHQPHEHLERQRAVMV